jgi:hypothetical protein
MWGRSNYQYISPFDRAGTSDAIMSTEHDVAHELRMGRATALPTSKAQGQTGTTHPTQAYNLKALGRSEQASSQQPYSSLPLSQTAFVLPLPKHFKKPAAQHHNGFPRLLQRPPKQGSASYGWERPTNPLGQQTPIFGLCTTASSSNTLLATLLLTLHPRINPLPPRTRKLGLGQQRIPKLRRRYSKQFPHSRWQFSGPCHHQSLPPSGRQKIYFCEIVFASNTG